MTTEQKTDPRLEILEELEERMTRGAANLQELAIGAASRGNDEINIRKAEKAAGMRVARGYVEETIRQIKNGTR